MNNTLLSKPLYRLSLHNQNSNKSGLLDYATILQCNIVEDKSVKQICTDGQQIRFNPDWWQKIDLPSQIFALAHEADHIRLNHVARAKTLPNKKKANIAADILINAQKLKDGHKPMRDIYITGDDYGIKDPWRYSFEQIYTMLKDENTQRSPEDANGDLGEGNDLEEPDSPIPPEQQAEILGRIIATAKGMGYTATKELEEQYEELTSDRLNWKEATARFIASMKEAHWSMQKPLAAYRARRIFMPGILRTKKLKFAFAIDTSGSIDSEIFATFVGHMRHAFDALKPELVVAILCDDLVRGVYELKDTPNHIPLRGRGCTDFRPVFNRISKDYADIGGLVYVTDGYGTFPEKAPDYPTLWVINNRSVTPPFGQVCRI
jgi:predicted metal-dependent peptidase